MKYIFSLAILLALGSSSYAQDGALFEVKPPGPYIEFTETEFNFGDIKSGDKVAHTFEFKNSGDAPLVISNVVTTCGCTASNWPRQPILPGESSKIDVTFDSAGKVGHQNKVITIMNNGSNNPERVKLVVNILPDSDS